MKKFFLLILGLILYVDLFAQPKEVTLVVSGEGANKTEATNNALRSAIEQAFGTFVSANTTILNDEIVRDEIATVSSGNVKSYKELAYSQLPDGRVFVSLNAEVSIGKLISYAKSHGSEAEFSGNLFSSNLKLYEMKKNASEKALKDLFQYMRAVGSDIYSYNIKVSDPSLKNGDSYATISVEIQSNENTNTFFNSVRSILFGISDSFKNVSNDWQHGFLYNPIYIVNRKIGDGFWTATWPSYKTNESDLRCFSCIIDAEEINSILRNSLLGFKVVDNNGHIYPFPFSKLDEYTMVHGQAELGGGARYYPKQNTEYKIQLLGLYTKMFRDPASFGSNPGPITLNSNTFKRNQEGIIFLIETKPGQTLYTISKEFIIDDINSISGFSISNDK